jgi:bifunctional non-homologous end joining protein LigD
MLKPMMPMATTTLPTGPEWTYEVKWDGYRILAVKDGQRVRLLSRTGTDLTYHFQRIARDIARLEPAQLVLDGEVVALDATGRPSFRGLQEAHRRIAEAKRFALAFYVFDLLQLNRVVWTSRSLETRRKRLGKLLRGETLLLSAPLPGRLPDIERCIKRFGLEGIVAKRRHSRYRPGARSDDWWKVRFAPRQEFVVGGYVPNGHTFDALLVGYYTPEGELRYAGQVRNGFTAHIKAALSLRLKLHTRGPVRCPFADLPHNMAYRGKHPWDQRITKDDMALFRWVSPSEVIEVSYLGWTRHALLRQAEFVGMRDDKPAHSVGRE